MGDEAVFVIVYRWKVDPELEEQFREGWETLTRLYIQLRGSLGSRLHQADDGTWLAYAEWPSRATWLAAIDRGVPDEGAAEKMNAAVLERYDPIFLTPVSDFLQNNNPEEGEPS
ncbi:MAG: antibiotic biosynthesis monooxygenase [Gammaproteobacteria bacterium]|jgi:hypothetical protein